MVGRATCITEYEPPPGVANLGGGFIYWYQLLASKDGQAPSLAGGYRVCPGEEVTLGPSDGFELPTLWFEARVAELNRTRRDVDAGMSACPQPGIRTK
jgi:hypothetical protein